MIEAYRLTLTHYAVGEEGERMRLDVPIVVEQVFDRKYWDNGGKAIVLNQLLEEMGEYLLCKVDEETK